MKSLPVLVCVLVLTLALPAGVPAQGGNGGAVSPEVARAFSEAGLPVLRRRLPPFDFSAALPDGTPRRLSELKGKVVFLNFWATWCGPCRQEMPSMDALYRRLKDQGLEILAVNVQEKPWEVSGFMENYKLSFKTVLDPTGKISGNYGISAFPTTFILDREGQIIVRVVGSLDWNTPRIITAFETLLKN
jgi:thiol-disulfide isomerase/thioredoxin